MFKDKNASLELANSNDYFLLKRKHRLFFFRMQFPKDKSVCNLVKVDDSQLWHERFGHINFADVKNTNPGISHCAEDVCEIFALFKITKVSVTEETEVESTTPLEKVSIDVLGPLNLQSVHRFRNVLMIVDEYSKFKVVKFLRAKREVSRIQS